MAKWRSPFLGTPAMSLLTVDSIFVQLVQLEHSLESTNRWSNVGNGTLNHVSLAGDRQSAMSGGAVHSGTGLWPPPSLRYSGAEAQVASRVNTQRRRTSSEPSSARSVLVRRSSTCLRSCSRCRVAKSCEAPGNKGAPIRAAIGCKRRVGRVRRCSLRATRSEHGYSSNVSKSSASTVQR